MSIGFLSALKVIPWSDVIAAAPGIVKGARSLFSRKPEAAPASPGVDPSAPAEVRIADLERRLATLELEHGKMAELAASLAEQNAQVVQAIEILRARTRLLLGAAGVFGLLLIAAVALSYSGFGGR